ncbi:TonB family protein [Dysgonomonas sp. PFB1-18]|uniref:energy transducer TonB n=1 Tax=unclassified Dysgonomonas TaxID=2630389 RepID=UPI002475A00A|nr:MULTISPECIES: energy transducer TonB [unclassified Dysgonomonas]MDH6311044.1 TonB family protein [Dysgonomonas sp. PF1-14]MDH6337893.1 TonB family protein [Dysgonomonas sp. PF1-16]MDH6382592.1 TonB family protein [Dysgonomonas sp. PFB1-18]MDH6398025.1 TonB family protein [Dysgonomonas sp. PF1-23]
MRTFLIILSLTCSVSILSQIKEFTPVEKREIGIKELERLALEEKKLAPEERKYEEKPFVSIEIFPEFVEGKEALQKFMGKNLKYKSEYRNDTLVTEIIIRFIVHKTGEILEPKILKGEDTTFAKAALAAVNKMPKWKPGKQCGVSVSVYYTILFRYDTKNSKVVLQHPYFYQKPK